MKSDIQFTEIVRTDERLFPRSVGQIRKYTKALARMLYKLGMKQAVTKYPWSKSYFVITKTK